MFKNGTLANALCTEGSLKLTTRHTWAARWMVVNYYTGCIDLSVLEAACRINSHRVALASARDECRDMMAGLSGVGVEMEKSPVRAYHWSEQKQPSVLEDVVALQWAPTSDTRRCL